MSVLCIIQARTGSTRLPGKILLKVKNITLLEYQIKRLRLSKKIDKIVIATTTKKRDDKIFNLCKKIKVDCFRGSEEDVLDRYYQCSLLYPQYPYILRLTSDCPLVDPLVIDKLIRFFIKNKCDYASNIGNERVTFPEGIEGEIFKKEVLIQTAKKASLKSDREHVSPFMRKNKKVKKKIMKSKKDFSHFRLVIDYPEDFPVIKFLIENSPINTPFSHYVSLLKKNPEIITNSKYYSNGYFDYTL